MTTAVSEKHRHCLRRGGAHLDFTTCLYADQHHLNLKDPGSMYKAWNDWLALNSTELVFTALVVALVAGAGVLMRYSL